MELPSPTLSILSSKEALLSVLLVLAALLLYSLWGAFDSIWWSQRWIRRMFQSQGIPCLPGRFIYGNLPELVELGKEAQKSPMPEITHDITPRIQPHLHVWSKRYGKPFVYWNGSRARFTLTHPQQAKEVLSTKFGHYRKAKVRPDAKDLIGGGLVGLEGEKWAQHRRIMNPAFFHEKLKVMLPTMASCTAEMMEQWKLGPVAQGHDIDVHAEFKRLTADIIAHTAFGSSYAEGKRVFELQYEQQILVNKAFTTVYIPGMRFIPTSFNRYRWKLKREINGILTKLIKGRLDSAAKMGHGPDSYGTDLLGLMMASNQGELKGNQKNLSRMGIPEIIGECKTFFFAGHETTSTLLPWACLLLATHPEWQDRAREEVVALCGKSADVMPSIEALNQMKILTMVLNETMRLYPPIGAMMRMVEKDTRLGGAEEEEEEVVIPAGTEIILPVLMWHHEAEYWGPDADEFRPERFEGGVAKACRVPGAYLPFSTGPRVCIGQGFAMMEAKTVLAAILRSFRFRLSPSYRHAPATVVTLQPQFGMPITFTHL